MRGAVLWRWITDVVSDANRLQRALDAAALAGAQELKQNFDSQDQFRAREAAALAREKTRGHQQERGRCPFGDNSTSITVQSRATRQYMFARIFEMISPGSATGGSVERRSKARVSSCAGIERLA
jgi:hypothetical protein